MTELKSLSTDANGSRVRFAVIDSPTGLAGKIFYLGLVATWTYGVWCSFVFILAGLMTVVWAFDSLRDTIGPGEFVKVSKHFNALGFPAQLMLIACLALLLTGAAAIIPVLLRRFCAVLVQSISLRYLESEPAAIERLAGLKSAASEMDWVARAALAVLAGSSPPTLTVGVPLNGCDASRGCEREPSDSWGLTVVAPPSINFGYLEDTRCKLRSFAASALHLTAPGEVEPIAGGWTSTRLAFPCGVFVMSVGMFFFLRGDWSLTFVNTPLVVFVFALLLLCAIDAGLLERAKGVVYAGPFTCTRVRPSGTAKTITGPAEALIMLRNWKGSGVGLVAGRISEHPLRKKNEQNSWLRFRLNERAAVFPMHIGLQRIPALIHAMAVWGNPMQLRAFITD